MSVTPAVLSTRINPFLATALRAHCKARGVSMNWAITRAIRDWLDRQNAAEVQAGRLPFNVWVRETDKLDQVLNRCSTAKHGHGNSFKTE